MISNIVYIYNIQQVFGKCGVSAPFGQTNVIEWLKATNIMNAMRAANVIKKVTGLGPGKYEFMKPKWL